MPVVASNASSIPEVAGNGAIMVIRTNRMNFLAMKEILLDRDFAQI